MKRKHPFLVFSLISALCLSAVPAVAAADTDEPVYVVPGGGEEEVPAVTAAPSAAPENTAAPSAEPEETQDPAGTAAPSDAPVYVVPGGENEENPQSTVPPEDGGTQDAAAFMDALTLAFFDGITELTPDSPSKKIMAVLTQVPGQRMGEAQWYLNGQPVADHYNGSFSIQSGKVTGLVLPVVFAKGMQETGVDVALEIRLDGAVRRIEKHVAYRNYTDEEYDAINRDRVLNLVRPMEIPAVISRQVTTYADKYLFVSNGSLPAGAEVIYVDHYSDASAYLYLPDEERFCWVSYYSVDVSDENLVVEGDYTDEDKMVFVNAKGYSSRTSYLIWINLEHQKVNLFIGEEGNWKLERVMDCATGANQTPTPTGITTYSQYSNGWFNPTYYVKPVLYINPARAIAMHSILFSPNGAVQDGTLGRNVSHGCVRLAAEDIQFLADYVPLDTTVVVF